MPFDLPQGWVWCRLYDILQSLHTGLNPRKFFKLNTPDASNYYVTIRELRNNRVIFSDRTDRINEAALLLCNKRSNLEIGDVLFGGTGSIGAVALISTTPKNWNIKEGVYALKPEQRIAIPRFLLYLLQTPTIKKSYLEHAVGATVLSVPMKELNALLIPLPPIAEQKRIIAKVEELFAIADSLGTAADELENAAKQLDKKILDLAIRGRLVPQDPNDEPASELVKRIAASHKSPCKNQSEPIHPPFEIPDSWIWVRLGAICEILDSKRKPVTKSNRKPGPYPYYGATCIQDFVSDFIFDEPLVLLGEDGAKWGKGDKSAFCVDGKIWVNNHAHVLRPCDGINHIYLVCTLDILDLMPYVTGTTVPKLNQEKMCDIQIPLPPLAEQKRIVAKIEELRAVIKSLTT